MSSAEVWAEVTLMVCGAFFGVAIFLCVIAAAIYYFPDRQDDA